MPSLIYHLPETILTFTSSGATGGVLTLSSLANGAARVSAQYDRGAGAKPGLYIMQAKLKWAAALGVGALAYVYLLQTSSSADVPGNLGTIDAGIAADKTRNLGGPPVILAADSVTDGENQISNSNIVEIYGRYISVAVYNVAGQSLHATGTNSVISLTPVPPQSQ